jgi:predicted MFS family arabinose efflux permease
LDVTMGRRSAAIVATVFLPFAAGYFLSYVFRTVNAVIAEDLAASIGVGAGSLGLLTAAFLMAFAAAQIPIGILLDRFGPRRVDGFLLLFAAAGCLVFAMGDDLLDLALGRALIGLGVSACLMAAVKAHAEWWPPEKLPVVNGAYLAAGGLGAIFATTPVAALLSVTDWRTLFTGLAVLSLAASLLVLMVVPEAPGAVRESGSLRAQIQGVGQVFRDPLFRRVAPASTMVQAGILAYAGLWAGPFIRDVGGFDRAGTALHLQNLAAAMVAGYLLNGWAAGRLARAGITTMTFAGTTMAVTVVVQTAIVADVWPGGSLVLWTLFGFAASGSALAYAILSQGFPPSMAGRASTSLNLLMFATAFLLQTGIGMIVGLFPAPEAGGFNPTGHRAALVILIVLEAAAVLWLFAARGRSPAPRR